MSTVIIYRKEDEVEAFNSLATLADIKGINYETLRYHFKTHGHMDRRGVKVHRLEIQKTPKE